MEADEEVIRLLTSMPLIPRRSTRRRIPSRRLFTPPIFTTLEVDTSPGKKNNDKGAVPKFALEHALFALDLTVI